MGAVSLHRVVIVGGGFGGLLAAKDLRYAPVEVTLLDRHNYHLFQPLLYQVATGGLSPANIASPLRAVLRKQKNVRVLLANVTGFDAAQREVLTNTGSFPYDTLIVAAGMRNFYFGKNQWAEHAPGLKTLEDATAIRRRVLLAFEKAEASSDPVERQRLMTFVIIGGGPTGVEMAGAIGELAHHTLRRNFRSISPQQARIILIEAGDCILPVYSEKLSRKAVQALERLGIAVRTKTKVTDITAHAVTLQQGEQAETLTAETTLWMAGVQASPLGKTLADATEATCDRQGRVIVEPDLTVKGHPEIYVVGDLAHFSHQSPQPLPGVAPVAMQQGRYVAKALVARMHGKAVAPFHYQDKGSMATIGRGAAVADLHWTQLSGYPAWLAWLFIHLMYIVGFENRLLVFLQWAWCYITRNRTARLITHDVSMDAEATK
jgi:NADH:ubiquinone reductase (H+-translocating)